MRGYYNNWLRSEGLAIRRFNLDGSVIDSTIAAKQEWTDLSVPLGGSSERRQLSNADRAIPARLTRQQVAAELNERTDAWSRTYGISKYHVFRCADRLLRSPSKPIDNPVYRVIAIEPEPNTSLEMTLGLDRYFSYRFTIGLLNEELAIALDDPDIDTKKILSNVRS